MSFSTPAPTAASSSGTVDGIERPAQLKGSGAADYLQDLIERARGWPIWSADRTGGLNTGTYAQVGNYGKSMRDIALWVALRENDREAIVEHTNWERDRPLHLDPLPERIPSAYSDLLYGEDPEFVAADKSDQELMDEMTAELALPMELKRWCEMSVSEGEMWWRAWTDHDVSEWPLVSAHSRLNVIPLFIGHKVVAAAFIENILEQEVKVENEVRVDIYRHVEIQTMGYVRNLLYHGSTGGLGTKINLSAVAETADLEEDWDHGLPIMLAGRIPNKLGRDHKIGISEFNGVRDLIMDLNEARTILAENARLVLKARMVVPANALDPEGNFDAGKDVIVAESLDEELAGKNSGPYAVLEYNFKSNELIQHKQELTLDILARVGLAEQFVQESRGGSGQAFTGTALRTRLIPTTLSASGKARVWDAAVPKLLSALAQLSALEPEKGGCGQDWKDAAGKHVQNRASVLPEDLNEETQRHVMAVQGEIESIQTAVEALHPDWDEEDLEREVLRIHADRTLGPTFSDPDADPDELRDLNLPSNPDGGPGSAVPGPSDVVGSAQPGVVGTPSGVDGQSPGKTAPRVLAGGPK